MMRMLSGGLLLTTGLVLLAGCGGGSGDEPISRPLLAGGGRGSHNDAPSGGGENSGPQAPGFQPAPGYFPLFYAELNCFDAPFTQVLTDTAAWEAWWATAISCQPRWGMKLTPPPPSNEPGSEPNSGGSGDPGWPDVWDPWPTTAPPVDFSTNMVAIVGLDSQAVFGRGLWVMDVQSDTEGTTVIYEVSMPGDDCYFPAIVPDPTAPVVAVLVPSIEEPVTFERRDTTWNCTWTPDPNEPWAIYFTDADCALGSNESFITTEAAWRQWLDAAHDCDLARWTDPIWGGGNGPTTGSGGSGGEVPPSSDWGYPDGDWKDHPDFDPMPPPPGTWGVEVNFDTHMILILRAPAQSRWGGGIWLNAINTLSGGVTEYEYSVMQPGSNCPPAEMTLRPTVAIRVPKPDGTVRFLRHSEVLRCDWDDRAPMPGNSPPSAPR